MFYSLTSMMERNVNDIYQLFEKNDVVKKRKIL